MNEITEADLDAAAVAPRVTFEQLLATITSEHYFTAAEAVAYSRTSAGERSGFERRGGKYRAILTPPVPPSLELVTFCILVLENGFTVHGTSACVSPENYDEAIGRHYAKEDAIKQLWPLLGYELKSQLYFDKLLADTFDEF